MFNVTKVDVIENISVESILKRESNSLGNYISNDQYNLFCNAFKHTVEERFPKCETFPKDITIALRTVVSDDKARYVRFYELSMRFIIAIGEEKKTQYDLTFEIYKTPEDEEDCELLSYYSAEYIKQANEG